MHSQAIESESLAQRHQPRSSNGGARHVVLKLGVNVVTTRVRAHGARLASLSEGTLVGFFIFIFIRTTVGGEGVAVRDAGPAVATCSG
jgi:hypothetical protein